MNSCNHSSSLMVVEAGWGLQSLDWEVLAGGHMCQQSSDYENAFVLYFKECLAGLNHRIRLPDPRICFYKLSLYLLYPFESHHKDKHCALCLLCTWLENWETESCIKCFKAGQTSRWAVRRRTLDLADRDALKPNVSILRRTIKTVVQELQTY